MKTILFGNGLNFLSDNYVSWEKLLEQIKGENLFENGKLPYTMIYERSIIGNPISFDGLTENEEKIKNEIKKMMNDFPTNSYYGKLLQLKAENYLTTNYDYAFIKNLVSHDYEIVNKSTEGIYSIRRYKEIIKDGKMLCKFWHIHGEIDTPPSIMLGLDHYCGNVGKIDSYIKGRYDFQVNNKQIKIKNIGEKLLNNDFDDVSWLELFFKSDIHILGLSLDYSEIDLWWILNKRARLKLDKKLKNKITNKIYYYTTKENEDLEGLLKTLNVKVINISLDESADKYKKAYSEIFELIKNT